MEEPALTPRNDAQLLEWMTILSAAEFDFRVERNAGRWALTIQPEERLEEAREEIDTVTRLNENWPPPEAPVRPGEFTPFASWGSVLLLCLIYGWLGPYNAEVPGHQAGRALGPAIRDGEWWRAVTALSLHGDLEHLLGNLLFLGIFGYAVCKKLGDGLGTFLILGGGALGNLLLAWTVDRTIPSVGASTASFAALGLLVSIGLVEKLQHGDWKSVWARAWIPLGGGLAMLAFTGMNPDSDWRAHIWGMVMGVLLGIPFGFPRITLRNETAQRALELGGLCLFLYAWLLAIDTVRTG